jgi:hypothetical protein
MMRKKTMTKNALLTFKVMSAPFIYIGQHYVLSRFDLNIIFNLIDVPLAFKILFIVIYMRYYYATC